METDHDERRRPKCHSSLLKAGTSHDHNLNDGDDHNLKPLLGRLPPEVVAPSLQARMVEIAQKASIPTWNSVSCGEDGSQMGKSQNVARHYSYLMK